MRDIDFEKTIKELEKFIEEETNKGILVASVFYASDNVSKQLVYFPGEKIYRTYKNRELTEFNGWLDLRKAYEYYLSL